MRWSSSLNGDGAVWLTEQYERMVFNGSWPHVVTAAVYRAACTQRRLTTMWPECGSEWTGLSWCSNILQSSDIDVASVQWRRGCFSATGLWLRPLFCGDFFFSFFLRYPIGCLLCSAPRSRFLKWTMANWAVASWITASQHPEYVN